MLQAEPIWLTAKRQGVRTLVHDWPLSHAQRGVLMRVKTLLNRRLVIATPLPEKVQVGTEGPVGMIYLDQLPADERAAMKGRLLEKLHAVFLTAYAREALPKRWGFDHPTRVGDV